MKTIPFETLEQYPGSCWMLSVCHFAKRHRFSVLCGGSVFQEGQMAKKKCFQEASKTEKERERERDIVGDVILLG